MHNRHVYYFAALLILTGIGLMGTRLALTGLPLTPGEMGSAWVLERQLRFEANGNPVKLQVKMPGSTQRYAVAGEWIIADQYGTSRTRQDNNRILTMATRRPTGPQAIYLRTLLHEVDSIGDPVPETRPDFVRQPIGDRALIAARNLLKSAERRSADDKTLVSTLISMLKSDAVGDSLGVIAPGETAPGAIADAVVTVLSLRGIAARRVNGVDLTGRQSPAAIVPWVEAWFGHHWQPFSLDTGAPAVPGSYLALWRGEDAMAELKGADQLQVRTSIQQLPQRVLDQVLAGKNPLKENLVQFSLYSLPQQDQAVFRTLLIVPLGIIALVLIRSVIGVKTIGTFMPVLIALALHNTHLIWGAAAFVGIVVCGLMFRLYLEHLKLLLIPRLAAVLIFVIILMAVVTSLGKALGLVQGISVALFPMVILTMTIERLSLLWDERGGAQALKQGAASLAVAMLLCILMSFPVLKYFFFTFPETLLVLLAIAMLLGRYTGYRLSELSRFRALGQ